MNTTTNKSPECVSTIHNQTNQRIYDRNIPTSVMQPYINVRPVMTKYSYFPIVDPRKKINVPMKQVPTYNVNKTFNPGTNMAPWSGFSTNINLESELRNQVYAIQKCSQSVYVPNSTSDLYDYTFKSVKQANPHDLLFKPDSFCSFNPNPNADVIGVGLFNNSTRSQLKDLSKQSP